jgi:hypothetical protein
VAVAQVTLNFCQEGAWSVSERARNVVPLFSPGIKRELEAQNPKNPNQNPYSAKPKTLMVSVGIENQNPILV